ncbi:MAG: SH3 domain-containing protein [SAR324 cluster bacterium]|nr:SH3 domain-containing protein [SAR324 cluster bacterium]
MKKSFFQFLLIGIGCFLYWQECSANPTIIISSEVQPVRELPGGHLIGEAFQGQQFEVLKHDNDWLKIPFRAILRGWVREEYIAADSQQELGHSPWKKGTAAVVSADILKVRESPSARQISRVYRGQALEVLKSQDGWVHIQYHINQGGWVHKNFVNYEGEQSSSEKMTPGLSAIESDSSESKSTLTAGPITEKGIPELLILFDQSGSMRRHISEQSFKIWISSIGRFFEFPFKISLVGFDYELHRLSTNIIRSENDLSSFSETLQQIDLNGLATDLEVPLRAINQRGDEDLLKAVLIVTDGEPEVWDQKTGFINPYLFLDDRYGDLSSRYQHLKEFGLSPQDLYESLGTGFQQRNLKIIEGLLPLLSGKARKKIIIWDTSADSDILERWAELIDAVYIPLKISNTGSSVNESWDRLKNSLTVHIPEKAKSQEATLAELETKKSDAVETPSAEKKPVVESPSAEKKPVVESPSAEVPTEKKPVVETPLPKPVVEETPEIKNSPVLIVNKPEAEIPLPESTFEITPPISTSTEASREKPEVAEKPVPQPIFKNTSEPLKTEAPTPEKTLYENEVVVDAGLNTNSGNENTATESLVQKEPETESPAPETKTEALLKPEIVLDITQSTLPEETVAPPPPTSSEESQKETKSSADARIVKVSKNENTADGWSGYSIGIILLSGLVIYLIGRYFKRSGKSKTESPVKTEELPVDTSQDTNLPDRKEIFTYIDNRVESAEEETEDYVRALMKRASTSLKMDKRLSVRINVPEGSIIVNWIDQKGERKSAGAVNISMHGIMLDTNSCDAETINSIEIPDKGISIEVVRSEVSQRDNNNCVVHLLEFKRKTEDQMLWIETQSSINVEN